MKIPKIKLSMELKNKRKIYDNKEYKNNLDKEYKNNLDNLDINEKQKTKENLSPKFLKLKPFFEEIIEKEVENPVHEKKDTSKKSTPITSSTSNTKLTKNKSTKNVKN